MIRDIFTHKWTIGSMGILILIAAACYLYYQQTTAHDREQAAQTDKLLQEWKAERTPKPTIKADQESTQTPAESTTPTAEKQKTDIHVTKNIEPTQTQTEVTAQTAQVVDVPVSPYGFGPYPKIPEGYLGGVDPDFWTYDWPRDIELLHRVQMKLWEEGKPSYGGTMSSSTGLVYPTFPNTIIVEWDTIETPSGTRRYATRTSWCPEAESFQRQMKGKIIYEGDFPSYLKIVERKDAGIDPYAFLDLPR